MATDIPMLDFDPNQERHSPATTNATTTNDGNNHATSASGSSNLTREYDPGYSGNDDPYEARNLPNGPYETLTKCIATPETQSDFIASGVVRPNVDYRVRVRHARRAGGWNKFQFYTPNGDEEEFRTLLYGELSDRQAGTRIGAMGNFYTGGNDSSKKIIDGTSVKNIYCLHHPSSAPPAIRVGFDNQLNALSAMADMVGELSHKEVGPVSATAPDGHTPIIKCSGPQVYKDCSRDPKPSTVVQNTTTPI
ncbi:PIF1 protein [Coprinopsis cinerea AmutBmut pab1-1]|nr:PIF1 protein [Coprinopsis cinerea AmutBmut pab1-1]